MSTECQWLLNNSTNEPSAAPTRHKRPYIVSEMKCPVDGTTLALSSRDGVEIDYCPDCRGVWLDRGELDKILDRASSAFTTNPEPPADRHSPKPDSSYDDRDRARYEDRDRDRTRYEDRDRYDSRKKRKRKNFLEEIFDFD